MGIIYCLSFPSGKVYVGQTVKKLNKRLHLHRCRQNHSWYVARAIKKYDWAAVKKTVLETVEDDELNDAERKWIAKLNCIRPHGYNLTAGGDFNPMSDEDVRRRHLEKVQSDKHRRSQALKAKEWHKDPDKHAAWKEKSTEAQRRPEVKAARAQQTKESWCNDDIRKKRIDGLAKAFSNPEVAKKRIDAVKASRTPEFSARISETYRKKREERYAHLPEPERSKKIKAAEKSAARSLACWRRKQERA